MSEGWPEGTSGRAWSERLADESPEARSLRELCHDLIGPAATIRVLAAAASAEASAEAGTEAGTEAGVAQAVHRRLQLIVAEAALIGDICAQVLGRSRSAGPVRLDRLAADKVESVRARCATTIELDAEQVVASVQSAVFARVLGNLLANACRAAGPDGWVHLAVTRDGDRARLMVEDSGPGFSGRPTGRRTLGLDIVWSLVLDSGGTVQMGTGGRGGLCVTVLFPCPAQAEAGPPGRRPGPVLAGAAARPSDSVDAAG